MKSEGYRFAPPSPGEHVGKISHIAAMSLENGDWSEDHGATIAGVMPLNHGQQYQIRFFENKHEPITIDRDDTLRVIRGAGSH